MFLQRDTPSQGQFEDLARRYDKMDIKSVQSLVGLMRTGSDLLAGFEKMLAFYGISQGRFLVLAILNRTPDTALTPSQLAEKLGKTRATITGLISVLEKDHLVIRQPDPGDRRKQTIRLTARGVQRLESILPDYYERINNLMQGLTPDQKTDLVAILEKVNTGIGALTEDRTDHKINLHIRRFSPCFKEQVMALILSIQQTEFHIPITAQDQPDLGDIQGFYQQGTGNFWIAVSQGQVVGSLSLKDIGNGQAALRKMFVHPDFRGKTSGTAADLLRTSLEWSVTKGISEIFLGTTDKFLAAHRFYEKNGFIPIKKEALPRQFPLMAVDTMFYTLHVQEKRTRGFNT